jgi:hypothetical protein
MEVKTYINILVDSLRKKEDILDRLIRLTEEQERITAADDAEMDGLEAAFAEKEACIAQLNQLDEGFEKVYLHVKEAFESDKEQYKDQILLLQDLIRSVTEKGTRLQALELKNRSRFQLFFANRKKEIKNFKLSSKTVDNYYKNAMNQQTGESFFLDKKK